MVSRRRLLLVLVVAVALGGVAVVGSSGASHGASVTGTVIDMAGNPIAAASVAMGDRATLSRADGSFTLDDGPAEGWLRADAAGYLPRLRPAHAGSSVVLRLTADDGQTISIVFGGDVMFGRRFFDPNQDGDRGDGLLSPAATVTDHERLLANVREPLEAADLAIVNVETPLVAQPYLDPLASRPSAFHPTKELVFASLPQVATALRNIGIDVVGLGNNHFYDALDAGAAETLGWLDAGGFAAGAGRTGAGMNEEEAWRPAVAQARGTSVAVVACTTIDGHETPPLYVATPGKPGAALCTTDGITAAVGAARTRASLVVVMIHGGVEYVSRAPDNIRELTAAAHAAGAALVINGHPHVVGGLEYDDGGLTAWTMGNLLFDQVVWPTFESYLLTVYVRNGLPIRAVADPLMINGFVPTPVVGELATHVARGAAGLDGTDAVVEDGALEVIDPSLIVRYRRSFDLGYAARGAVMRLTGGAAVDPASLAGSAEVGNDLLWTGSFEDELADGIDRGAPLWLADGDARVVGPAAAADGQVGVRIERVAGNSTDAVLQPSHRILITAGAHLTFLGRIRASAGTSPVALQFSWYNDLKGASATQSVVTLPAGAEWMDVRVDLVAPANAIAVLPLVRLGPPSIGRASVDVDDVRLIEWHAASAGNESDDYIRLAAPGPFDLVANGLPGAGAAIADPEIVSNVAPIELPQAAALPPPPSGGPLTDDD